LILGSDDDRYLLKFFAAARIKEIPPVMPISTLSASGKPRLQFLLKGYTHITSNAEYHIQPVF
jgi:hypothetical protein